MYIADMHCDTISKIYKSRKEGQHTGISVNQLQVDVEKLQQGGYMLQNFAIFTDMKEDDESPYQCAKNQIALFLEEMKKNDSKIRQIKTFEEIKKNHKKGVVSALLTLEEGEICGGSFEKLKEFYELGARMMTFTWNYENSLGTKSGLTELGIAFLKKMEEFGIIADVSHLSDAGFYDVYHYSTKPFVASHSNARALCSHKRNLKDDMIRKVAEKGGVIGINYYGRFLEDSEDGENCGRAARAAEHILHMIHTGGISCVGLGSDFDGFSGKTEIMDCSKINLLVRELERRGLSSGEIEAVLYKNVLRVYEECL